MEKPLTTGAVMPSGRPLARATAKWIDPEREGPVIELGPGTNPTFCRLLRTHYPDATVVQGDAYSIRRLLGSLLRNPAAAVVSGLPLFTKPLRFRLRLLADAFTLLAPEAPFVQFTYALVPPIPSSYSGRTPGRPNASG
jgi:phosphatidylethanolamine/phosphatidyl-N-methylethanolamine N-methyltransferase